MRGRPPRCRRVSFVPEATFFKPVGTPMRVLEEVTLSLDEAEAIRLKDLEGLEQEEGADKMGISRPTFQRILASARQKVADALLNGKAIRIEGGNFELVMRRFRCTEDGHEWELPTEDLGAGHPLCPRCHSPNALSIRPGSFGRGCGRGRQGGAWCPRPGPGGEQSIGTDLEGAPGTGRQARVIHTRKGGAMRIAISATGTELTDQVDPRFGRSRHFIIFDPETSLHEVMENASAAAGGGAGIATAQMILDKGIRVVLTGDCGPNAYQVLSAAGVQVITNVSGTIREAIEAYKAGRLLASSKPSVDAHHGLKGAGA